MKIVVFTCDGYEWMVPVFSHFCKKYWPDNPYQIEIVTETEASSFEENYQVYYAGKTSWASRMIRYLEQSKENKFLLIAEELFIGKPVDTRKIKIAEILCGDNVGCVRLNAGDKWFKRYAFKTDIKGFREYPLDKPYSLSLQVAIWRKRYLLDILRDGEEIQATELKGSERLKSLKNKWRVLWTETPIINSACGDLMKKGRPRLSVVKWALLDLING